MRFKSGLTRSDFKFRKIIPILNQVKNLEV